MKKIIEIEGKTLIFETGKIAKQANGSVLLHSGETTLLSTVCCSKKPLEDIDFLPLKVDYIEKFSAAGKTLGGFIKREGKPSNKTILVSRFIDRSIRPLFPEGYYYDTQILSYVYSYDGINTPDVLAICASSAALLISDITFTKAVAAVRVGLIEDLFVINPNPEEQKNSKLDLILAGTENGILMIEGFADFLEEKEILEAIEFGHGAIKKICIELQKWQKEVGKEKLEQKLYALHEGIMDKIEKITQKDLQKALTIKNKKERELLFCEVLENVKNTLITEDSKFSEKDISIAFKKYSSFLMRQMILKEGKRIDGRKFDEIRPIDIELGLLPRTHGNAIFTRGETQTIAVCTLGSETMVQRYEDLHEEGAHRFYFQYFFPPFSVGEVGRMGYPGRREIGHGKLAEKALMHILPKREDFPYVIRLESNITESNGSSSMASVCGGCLALMNSGVPIKKPVAGIAMGLILENDEHVVLSDILGVEDALGDMDFKIAGDENGITAFQMDIKVEGISKEIMEKALMQAKKGKSHILKKMNDICPKPKEKLSTYAPRITTIQIKSSQIGIVIGSGGKTIKEIMEKTKTEIDISNDGFITISGSDEKSIVESKEWIKKITEEPEVGKTYDGIIISIKPFGLFIKFLNHEGFCHISQVSHSRIKNLFDVFKVGDSLKVQVTKINDEGKIEVSHKALLF